MTKLAWVSLRSMVSCMSLLLGWLVALEEVTETVEPPLGIEPLPADPGAAVVEGADRELVGADPAELLGGDDPGCLQHAEVLVERGERHREGLGQLARGGRSPA